MTAEALIDLRSGSSSDASLLNAVRKARTAYGRTTAIWSAAGRHVVEEDWWMGLSGSPHVDYNMALLHGQSAVEVAPTVLGEITAAKVPSVIMLAGAGLAASQVLADAGWVTISAAPFMIQPAGRAEPDPAVRQLRRDELQAAHALASGAFGIPVEVGTIVYADYPVELGYRSWGLFEGDDLVCAVASADEDIYRVGWALATDPARQRNGYAGRMLRALAHERDSRAGGPFLLLASPAGQGLYEKEGYTTLEYWQIWSRPRWAMAVG
jgi:GNAT superfamily N-acetyltransferase